MFIVHCLFTYVQCPFIYTHGKCSLIHKNAQCSLIHTNAQCSLLYTNGQCSLLHNFIINKDLHPMFTNIHLCLMVLVFINIHLYPVFMHYVKICWMFMYVKLCSCFYSLPKENWKRKLHYLIYKTFNFFSHFIMPSFLLAEFNPFIYCRRLYFCGYCISHVFFISSKNRSDIKDFLHSGGYCLPY